MDARDARGGSGGCPGRTTILSVFPLDRHFRGVAKPFTQSSPRMRPVNPYLKDMHHRFATAATHSDCLRP